MLKLERTQSEVTGSRSMVKQYLFTVYQRTSWSVWDREAELVKGSELAACTQTPDADERRLIRASESREGHSDTSNLCKLETRGGPLEEWISKELARGLVSGPRKWTADYVIGQHAGAEDRYLRQRWLQMIGSWKLKPPSNWFYSCNQSRACGERSGFGKKLSEKGLAWRKSSINSHLFFLYVRGIIMLWLSFNLLILSKFA